MKMKLYYVAYYHHDLKMISGPYGDSLAAYAEYEALTKSYDEEKLKVVSQSIEVIEE
jgi:hypothetical protein